MNNKSNTNNSSSCSHTSSSRSSTQNSHPGLPRILLNIPLEKQEETLAIFSRAPFRVQLKSKSALWRTSWHQIRGTSESAKLALPPMTFPPKESRKRGAESDSPASSPQRSRNSGAHYASAASDTSERIALEIEAKFHALAAAAEERHRRQYAEMKADFDKVLERSAAEVQFTQHRLHAKESEQMQLEHAISAGSARLEISSQNLKIVRKCLRLPPVAQSIHQELGAARQSQHDTAEQSQRLRRELQDAEGRAEIREGFSAERKPGPVETPESY